MVYVHKLIIAGMVERTGETQESDDPKAAALEYPERVFVRLTDRVARAPLVIWRAPLRIWYKPLDWEKVEYGEYTKPRKRKRRVRR